MKRWQVEQILYLNDFGKRKLTVPESHHMSYYSGLPTQAKKENMALMSLRKVCGFFLKVL